MTRLNVGAGSVGRGRRVHKILGRVPKYESWNPILQHNKEKKMVSDESVYRG